MMNLEQCLFVLIMLLFTALGCLRNVDLAAVLLLGLGLRFTVAALEHVGIVALPWSGADSETFYSYAQFYASVPLSQHISEFDPRFAWVYSWVLGFFIRVFGSEYFFLRSLNILIYSVIGLLIYRSLTVSGSSKKNATLGVLIYTLFPITIVLNSVLLREALVTLGVSISLYGFCLFYAKMGVRGLFYIFLGAMLSALFHGAFVLLGIAYMAILVFVPVRSPAQARVAQRHGAAHRLITLFAALCVLGVLGGMSDHFSKVGGVTEVDQVLQERLDRVSTRGSRGESGYAGWLTDNAANPAVQLVRFAYFVAAPFPWDYRNGSDIAAGVCSAFFAYLLFMTVRGRKISSVNKVLSVVAMGSLLAFSIGTDNVGTALRHKSKFFPFLIVAYVLWRSQRQRYAATRDCTVMRDRSICRGCVGCAVGGSANAIKRGPLVAGKLPHA